MNGAQQHASVIDDAWDSVVGGFHWLKSVLLGEFEDNRPLSAIIADMLVSFIPAVVIATSARDAIAVILRMAKHPEKREEVLEWVLLCACLITIALPIAMAAAGVAAAGVGAVVGGIAGSELGAALRAVMLLLVKASTKLVDVIHFLQKFIRGDILKFLKAIKFAKYEQALLSAVRQFTGKLIEITQGLAKHLESLSYFQYTRTLIAKLKTWERSFYAVQAAAIRKIPLAMAELDARLAKVLAETLPRETHTVPAGVKAPRPQAATPVRQEVHDVPGRILQNADASASRGGTQSASGRSSSSAATPKPPSEKPPRKDKPDDVPPAENSSNTKKQHVTEPQISVEEKIRQRQADNQKLKDSPKFQEDMQKVGVDEKQIADMNNKVRPLGFQSKEQFEQFKGELNGALVKDGLEDAEVGLKGTATTFYSENPGKPLGHHWDADPAHPGDFDLNVSSEKMVKNFNQAGVSPSETYGIFKTKDMNTNNPALNDFQKKWSKELGRDVNFVGNPSPPTRDSTEYILRSPS